MGNESSSEGCSSSSSECWGGGGVIASADGRSVSMTIDRDGSIHCSSDGRYADTSSRDSGVSSDAYVYNMHADQTAPVTEHTHTGSLAMSAAVDVLNGGGPDGTSMRHDGGQFHSHTHDPIGVSSLNIGLQK